MKSLTAYINEAKASKEGKSTWESAFNLILNLDGSRQAKLEDFKEIQEDEKIFNLNNGQVVDPNELYSLYKKNGNRQIKWRYQERSNEYILDDGENKFYFKADEPYPNGL